MRHDVEGEVECAAPDIIDLGFPELRINLDHAAAQDFGASGGSSDQSRGRIGAGRRRASGNRASGGSSKDSFSNRRSCGSRAECAGQRFRKNFRSDDERPDGNEFLRSAGVALTRVSAGADETSRAQSGPREVTSFHPASPCATGAEDARREYARRLRLRLFIAARASPATVASGIAAGTDLIDHAAVINS